MHQTLKYIIVQCSMAKTITFQHNISKDSHGNHYSLGYISAYTWITIIGKLMQWEECKGIKMGHLPIHLKEVLFLIFSLLPFWWLKNHCAFFKLAIKDQVDNKKLYWFLSLEIKTKVFNFFFLFWIAYEAKSDV